jgi:type I restriction enzyme S subunit
MAINKEFNIDSSPDEKTDLYSPYFPNKWEQYSLYDLADWKNGLAFKNIQFSDIGLPVIKIAELKNGLTDQTKYTEQTFDDSVFLSKGDLIFSWSGNPQTSIDAFWYALPDGWLNQHIFKVSAKPIVDETFLYYILKYVKPNFIRIASNKQTIGLGHVTIQDLKEIKVAIPALPIQKSIANNLLCLDDKIENNHLIQKTIEKITSIIFADFLGNAKKSKGWRKGKLSDLVEVKYGKAQQELEAGGIPAYGSGGVIRYVNKSLYTKQSVLIPRKGTLNNIVYSLEPFWATDTMFFTTEKVESSTQFVYQFLKTKDLASMDAGTAVPSMTIKILNEMEMPIPDMANLSIFEDKVAGFAELCLKLEKETTTLSSIRDLLLPKLMSGEIEVEGEE